MKLEVDRKVERRLRLARPSLVQDRAIQVNGHAVVQDRDPCLGGLSSRVIPAGRREPNVIRLPRQRWKTHVDVRALLAIESAALVLDPLQSERIEDLNFVSALDVDSAVAATLATGGWHVRSSKFGVQLEVADRKHSRRTGLQEPIRRQLGSLQ